MLQIQMTISACQEYQSSVSMKPLHVAQNIHYLIQIKSATMTVFNIFLWVSKISSKKSLWTTDKALHKLELFKLTN